MVTEDSRRRKRGVPPGHPADRVYNDLEYPDEYYRFLEDGEIPLPGRTSHETDEVPDLSPPDDLYWREPEQIWADDMWPWPEESGAPRNVKTDPS